MRPVAGWLASRYAEAELAGQDETWGCFAFGLDLLLIPNYRQEHNRTLQVSSYTNE